MSLKSELWTWMVSEQNICEFVIIAFYLSAGPSLPLVIPGVFSSHIELIPLFSHRHPNIIGEDAVEYTNYATLEFFQVLHYKITNL